MAWSSALACALIQGSPDAAEPVSQALPVGRSLHVDPSNTRVEFEVAALWILRRHGVFQQIEGQLQVDPDARMASIGVRIRVASVVMKNPKHVELLLSPAFFDVEQYPWIEFDSEPFSLEPAERLALPGSLLVHGIRRHVEFDVDTRGCSADRLDDCEVIVNGSLQRSQYGMTEYRRTLADEVHLTIAAALSDTAD
jgi:polyisoprenoid-binding protein YceI